MGAIIASNSLGVLTLDLVARLGGYEAGLDKAEKEAKKRAAAIEKAFDDAAKGIGIAFGAIAAAGVAAFAGFQAATQFVGDFQDLADKTGASAEGLASFAVAAGTAGVSMDEIAGASVKLTKGLTGVDDESKAAGAALSALGISIEDFKNLSPEDQLEEVAKQLDSVGNSADQVAIAMDLFGKSGAQIIPFLKTLNEQGGRNVILTAEMIKQADDYADEQAKVTTELKLYAGVLASQALPAVTAFTSALIDTIKEVLGLDKGATDLKNNKSIQDFAEGAVRVLGFVVDAADGVIRVFQGVGTGLGALAAAAATAASGELKSAYGILKEGASDIDALANKSLFSDKLKKSLEDMKRLQQLAAQENRGFTPAAPGRTYGGATSGGGRGRGGGAGKDPTAEAQRYIESLQKQLEKTQELTVYEQALKDIQMGRIGQVTEAQKELILSTAKQIDALKEQKKQEEEMKKYKEAVDKVKVSLLEMQGHTAEAAAIKFDQENSALYTLFSDKGDAAMVKKLDTLKKLTVATAQLKEEQDKYASTTENLRIQEERIALNQQMGIYGELDGLKRLGEARTAAYEQQREQYEKIRAIADASGDSKLIQEAERLKLELDQLGASLDPLAEKFNTMFADKAADAFTSFIDGTKTAKEAANDFINGLISDFLRLAAQDVFKSLFSGGGSHTGGVGFDWGSIVSSLFSGTRALGGPVMPNSLYQVNENGPELFQAANGNQYLMTGTSSGTVIPNAGGGTSISVNVAGNVTRDTAEQLAQKISLRQRAAKRYA